MIKRTVDIIISSIALALFSPLLFLFGTLIFLQDFKNPLYIAKRVGKEEKIYKMIKLRSMIVNADQSGVDSTSTDDVRITRIGSLVRKYKLDELTQLINVLKGDMSLVGPRPNVLYETNLYSSLEKKLLSVRPGITDFASIVFSDEGDILKDSKDPDLDYNQLIRPGKNILGLFYIEKSNTPLDLYLCFLTLVAIISKSRALYMMNSLLLFLKADPEITEIALRDKPLVPRPPPGLDEIVSSR